jgi:dTDP-4-amino-4,6-dideoxygalactose transaminase
LHLQSAYQRFWQKEQKLSVSEQLSYTVLSLPISPFVTKEQQELVSTAIKNYYLQSYS